MFKGSIIKKCISLVMVIAVLMGIAAPASAATAELLDDSKIGYVALGDAITGGYGLEQEETRYYQIVAEYLGYEDAYVRKFGNRWRAEELRYLLDNDYKGDGYTKKNFKLLSSQRADIQDAVKDAEVVTVQIGVNNFATYFVEQLMNYLDPTKTPYEYDFDQVAKELFDFQDEFSADEITNAVATVREAVMEQLLAAAPDEGDIALEFIEYAIEVATYSLLSYVTSFNGMVNAIYELNPNVDLYVIGIYNPAAGEVLTYRTEDHVVAGELIKGREIEIPIGDAIGAVIELANSYAQILAPRAFNYTYVDPGTPIKLIDKMADKALPLDERIPVAIKTALLESDFQETAVTLIQELFAEYGISKTYKEALAIAEEIVNCKTDELRDEYILSTVNDLVVEEAVKLFHEKMKEYIGDFGTVPVTDQQIAELLADLTDARDNGEDERAIAQKFVDGLVTDPDVIKMAAANKIYEYVVEYGLSDFVTVENVAELMTVLDDPNKDHDDRIKAVCGWMNGLAVSFIYDYVSAYNAKYTDTMAEAMLSQMENPTGVNVGKTPEEIAIDYLAKDAFAPVVEQKFTERGYALQGYSGDYVAFTKAVFVDSGMTVFRNELNAAAAAKYADDFAGGDATFAAELVGMLNALQDVPASGRSAAFDSWVNTITSGNEGVYKFLKTSLLDLYETEYLPAATAVENTFVAYKAGVLKAIDSLTQYVGMKESVTGTIVNEYEAALEANNGNPLFGDYGYVADPTVVDKAVDGIMDGFDMYYSAIEKCYASCDALTGKIDKIFAKLAKIAEVDEICLNDILDVAKKVVHDGGSYIDSMIGNLMQGDSLMNSEMTVAYMALCYYFADGIMHLPSEEGHKIMANQVIKAIKGEPTNSTTGWLANLVIDKMIDIYHMPTSASGQKNPLINPDSYVAFGDNITLGSGTAIGAGDKTYVELLADALAMEYEDTGDFDSDVILNLSLAGMRTEELLAIVDGTYNGDAYTDARFDIEELRNLYLAQIKDLDLVTINVGINNLVTYPLTQALLAYDGKTPYEMDWERYLGKELNSKVTSGKNAVMDLLNHIVHNDSTCETTLNTVATAVEAIAYSLVGYIVNLDCAVEKIHNSNPDAVIVLTEFYNPLLDTYFTTPGTITLKNVLTGGEKTVELKQYQIDVSDIADGLINLANRFLTGYVGGYKNGVVARVEDSNIVTVPLNETPLDIDPSVSKDLSDLVEVITVNVAGRDITIKVPEYLKEAVATGGVALHPNAEGHKYIYEQILKALEFEIYADVIVDDLHITYGEADPSTNDYLAYIDDLSSLYDITINSITHAGAHMTERGWCDAGVYELIVDYSFEDGYKEIDHEWGYLYIDKLATEITVSVKNGVIQDITDWGKILEADQAEVFGNLSIDAEGNVICASDLINKNYDLKINVVNVAPEQILVSILVENATMYTGSTQFPEFVYSITANGASIDTTHTVKIMKDGVVYTDPATLAAGEYEIVVTVNNEQYVGEGIGNLSVIKVDIGSVNIFDCALNLEGEIHYNFILNLSGFNMEQIKNVYVLKFNTKPASMDVSVMGYEDDIASDFAFNDFYGRYVVRSNGVPAKEMGDDAWYRVCVELVNGQYVYSSNRVKFNAELYCQRAIASSLETDSLKALCVSLMNYGAAAQVYFDHNANDLMNTFISDKDMDRVVPFDASMFDERIAADKNKHGVFKNPAKYFYNGWNANLTLEGAIALNVNVPHNAGEVRSGLYVWNEGTYTSLDMLTTSNYDKCYTDDVNDDTILVKINDIISAKDMDKTIFCCAFVEVDGVEYYSSVFRVSIDRYLQLLWNENGHESALYDLVEFTTVYGEYAHKYFYE